jgi:dihydrofolate synthase/folylpolyglutamate synthase
LTYTSALSSLNTLHPLGIRPGLERIRALLKVLGNPERGMKVIHVAGSNGKGSVCRILESVLVESGYRTGMFISPHLVDFRERFRVDGADASPQDVAKVWPRLQRAMASPQVLKFGPPTFFEAVTALAFLIFKRRRCELLVLETGLGGRFDSTNVIPKPLLTVITNISLEHTQILGKTEEKIAWEKAGILKKGSPVVTAAKGSALKVIRRVAGEVGSGAFVALKGGTNWKVHQAAQSLRPRAEQFLDIEVLGHRQRLTLPLLGAHQRVNLACALASIELLRQRLEIPERALIRGVAKASWPGRLQLLSRQPLSLIDGAHNPAGAKALVEAVRAMAPKRVLLVAGVLKDKDWKAMFRTLAKLSRHFFLAKPADPRGLEAGVLADFLGPKAGKRLVFSSPARAYAAARRAASKKDLIVVAGSLYVVGEILKGVDLKPKGL